jgi:Thioredoxin like C-terminal domain
MTSSATTRTGRRPTTPERASISQRLYQLVRSPADVAGHTFEIRFLDPGVQADAFTFG